MKLAKRLSSEFNRMPNDFVVDGAITQLPLAAAEYSDLRSVPIIISGARTSDIAKDVQGLFQQHEHPLYKKAKRIEINRDLKSLEDAILRVERLNEQKVFLVGVGAGFTSEAMKVIAAKTNVPWIYFMTATSTDAVYSASLGAEMKKLAKPYSKLIMPLPTLVIADPSIIINAPPKVNRAGIGDLEPTGARDWELAVKHDLPHEGHFNSQSVDLVRDAFWNFFGKYAFGDRLPNWFATYKSAANLDDEQKSELKTIYSDLASSLINSGKAMAKAKNSSPASGDGHKLLHLLEGKTAAKHGDLAGLTGLLMLYLQSKFFRDDRAGYVLHAFTRVLLHRGYGAIRNAGLMEVYRDKRSKDNPVSWVLYRNALEKAGLPVTAELAGLSKEEWLSAAKEVPTFRTERSGICTLICDKYGKNGYDKIVEKDSRKLKII